MPTRIHSSAPMGAARSHFGAVAHAGRIYVFGGGGSNFSSLDTVEAYDPQTDRWTDCAPMPSPRSGIAAAVRGDRIYVMGGGFRLPDGTFDFKSVVDVYLPREDRWEPGPTLLMRHDAPASITIDDKILLFGGHHPDAPGGPLTDPAFDFCERLGSDAAGWQQAQAMPTPRFSLSLVQAGDQVWAIGGGAFANGEFANLDLIEAYDPAHNRWHTAPTRLPWPGAGLYATQLGTTIWVAGGNDGQRISNRMARYHLHASQWEECPSLPEGRVMGMLIPVDGTLWLLGGRTPDAKTPTASCYKIDVTRTTL